MDGNVIKSLFGCFDRLQRNNSLVFYGLLRTLVDYFSVINQNNQINSIYTLNIWTSL